MECSYAPLGSKYHKRKRRWDVGVRPKGRNLLCVVRSGWACVWKFGYKKYSAILARFAVPAPGAGGGGEAYSKAYKSFTFTLPRSHVLARRAAHQPLTGSVTLTLRRPSTTNLTENRRGTRERYHHAADLPASSFHCLMPERGYYLKGKKVLGEEGEVHELGSVVTY